MRFHCNRCGYGSKYKHHIESHLKRKKPCIPKCELVLSRDPLIRSKEMLDKISPNVDYICPAGGKIGQKKHVVEPHKDKISPKKNSIKMEVCQYCNREFVKLKRHTKVCKGPVGERYTCSHCGYKASQASHLQRHMHTCKFRYKPSNFEEVEQLREEIKILKANIQAPSSMPYTRNITNNITNNTTNNTNNVTIVLNCFGKENLDHITPQYLKQLINGPFTSTSEIIKSIHFDISHPENANVKISNKKLPWAEVYYDDKWMMKKKVEVLEGMVDNGFNLIDEAYHNINPAEISTYQKDRYNAYQQEYKSKHSFRKQLVKDAELIVLNH